MARRACGSAGAGEVGAGAGGQGVGGGGVGGEDVGGGPVVSRVGGEVEAAAGVLRWVGR